MDACLGQTFGVADRQVLDAAIGVVERAIAGSAGMHGLLQGVEHETCVGCPPHAPPDNAAGLCGVHEGGVDEARPGVLT